MRVAILTITDGQNYGNRLQNYALQQVLKKLDCETETIRMYTYRDRTPMQEYIFALKQVVKRTLFRRNTCFGQLLRKKRFRKFNRLIRWAPYVLQNNKMDKDLSKKYDYFICGSDQIWNTRIRIVRNNILNHLACFAPGEKRISYAASFGGRNLEADTEEIFRKELFTFKSLSVREESGIDIVKSLCNRNDVKVVLDPTLMLSAADWSLISTRPAYIKNKRFILTYFLGGRSKDLQFYIEDIANKFQATPINLDIEFLSDDLIANRNVFCTTPDEFIWLVEHAECVLTDSFHATAFAILFHKPFAAFQRKATENGNDMGARLESLLRSFNIMRFKGDIDNPTIIPDKYDYVYIDEVLRNERRLSGLFLRNALQ